MLDVQSQHSLERTLERGDIHSLHDIKTYLISHDWIGPATNHLCNTIYTSQKHRRKCDSQCSQKSTELGLLQQNLSLRIHITPSSHCPKSIIDDQAEKHEQSRNLPYDTRNHQVGPDVSQVYAVASSTSETTSHSLEHEGNKVTGYEANCVVSSFDLASFLPECEHNVFQGQVNAGCDECWGEYQARDLDLEPKR